MGSTKNKNNAIQYINSFTASKKFSLHLELAAVIKMWTKHVSCVKSVKNDIGFNFIEIQTSFKVLCSEQMKSFEAQSKESKDFKTWYCQPL